MTRPAAASCRWAYGPYIGKTHTRGVRVLNLTLLRKRGDAESKPCEHADCGRPTSGRKPLCIDHLADSAYVRAILADITRCNEANARCVSGRCGPFEADSFVYDPAIDTSGVTVASYVGKPSVARAVSA